MLQFNKRRHALATLRRLFERPEHALVIHYSCESFADRPKGRSPRITSIAIRNLSTAHTVSFSIHQVAERTNVSYEMIPHRYDELERQMLTEFYDYVSKHTTQVWVHWNMRDINFGFPALAHRFRVLGGNPIELPDERLVDASRLFVAMYGVGYMKHPRLENLLKLNDVTMLNFLTGAEEAAAFDAKEYFKLHQSTLRKVDNLANVLDRAASGRLKTYSTWSERHGVSVKETLLAVQAHPVVTAIVIMIGVAGSLFTIFGVSLKDCRGGRASDAGSVVAPILPINDEKQNRKTSDAGP